MPIFEQGDIVKVPFPYTDRPTRQRRPALVVSTRRVQSLGLLWVAMVTSAENRAWPDDVAIDDLSAAGLPAASIVRPIKLATIDARDAELLGRASAATLASVLSCIVSHLGP
jgi:mRNA interferase MazF